MPRCSGWGKPGASDFTAAKPAEEGAAAQVGDLGLGSIVVFFDRSAVGGAMPAAHALMPEG